MLRLTIRVVPQALKDELVSRSGVLWKIRLTAPPVDGKANEALIRFLAKTLRVASCHITITKGHTSRTKIVEITAPDHDLRVSMEHIEKHASA